MKQAVYYSDQLTHWGMGGEYRILGATRETRERGGLCWLLKLRPKRDSKSTCTCERGPSLVGDSLGSSYRVKRFLSCLGCSSRPSTLLHFICPHPPASWEGSRAAPPVSSYVSMTPQKLEIQVRCNLTFSVILSAQYSCLELYLARIFELERPQTNENYAFRKPRTGCRENMKYNVNAAHC